MGPLHKQLDAIDFYHFFFFFCSSSVQYVGICIVMSAAMRCCLERKMPLIVVYLGLLLPARGGRQRAQ